MALETDGCNQFGLKEIADDQLSLADIPLPDADCHTIFKFALTYDAYTSWGSFEKCAEIANAPCHNTLADLRTCLFFEQRRWHHFGTRPNDETMVYLRSLIEKVRSRLT